MSLVSDLKTILNQQTERIDWPTYFSVMSLLISSRSPCHRLHVGCVLIRDNRVLSTGYNGFLPNAPHKSMVIGGHEQATVHAEVNAISYAAKNGIRLDGATAYITHYPCLNCCKSLLSSGVKEIIYLDDYRNDPMVDVLCRSVGVKVSRFPGSETNV